MAPQFSQENLQRVGVLAALPPLLRRFGVEPPGLLAEVGLGPLALDNPESTIPYRTMGRLLKAAAERTRCPHLGLLLGRQISTASLGLVGELVRNAPTLGIALRDFAAHQHRNAHGSVVYLLGDNYQVVFGYAVYMSQVPGSEVICDIVTMGGLRLINELAGVGPSSVLEVLLCRPEPEDLTPYRELLGGHLRFNAEQSGILLPRNLLDRPVPRAKPELRPSLEKLAGTLWLSGELDVLTRLRRTIRIALIEGHVTADEIAPQLGLGRRTLDRRLRQIGVTFQVILDETRCEFAQQLLTHTRLGVGEIAAIIGFSDPSVLTRAYIRWTGQSPSDWRSARPLGEA